MKKIIALFLAALTISGSVAANAAFYERTSPPGTANLNYYNTNYNPFYTQNLWSYCTWYCYGRAREILETNPKLSTGPASAWFNHNKANNFHPYSTNYNEAKIGAIICYKNSVAIVESVNSDGSPRLISGTGSTNNKTANFNVEKWNPSRPFYFGAPWMSRDDFVGYIYIIDDANYKAPQQDSQAAGNAQSSEFNETGYVKINDGYLNIRSEAKIGSNIVGSLNKGATVSINRSKSINGWYYIKYGNIQGYVSGKYIVLV